MKKQTLLLHFHIQSAKSIKSSRTRRKRLLFVLEVGEKLKYRTKIVKKTEDPTWDERGTMDLGLIDGDLGLLMLSNNKNEKVRMSVWDVKTKTNQKCKGARSILMRDLIGGDGFLNNAEKKEKRNTLDVELEGCTRGVGSVQVELMFAKEAVFIEDEGAKEEEEVFKTPVLKVKEENKPLVIETKRESDEDEDAVNDSGDPSKEELLRERVKKMQTESMEKKLERMEDPDMLTKEERRMLTEGADVAKDLGAELPKYLDDVSSSKDNSPSNNNVAEEKVVEDEEDEWENALPTKKKNANKIEPVSISPVKKTSSGDIALQKLETIDASIDHLEQQQPSSPTVIPERKEVVVSSSSIAPTAEEKKSSAMNELRRKQSSERIHARAIAAREALRQSKSSQINDELDELYERVVVSPSSGVGNKNTNHRETTAASSEAGTAKKALSLLSSSSSEEDEEEEDETVFVSYAEKPKPMTLAEAEMFRDAKKVSLLMQRAESAFTKWM